MGLDPGSNRLPNLMLGCLVAMAIAVHLPAGVRAAPDYPLSIAEDGRHVVDDSGHPVFFHLESAWFLTGSLDREDTALYFDDRVRRGFNGMLLQFPMPNWFDQIENAYGEPPFVVEGDFTTPNEAYFAHADWIVEAALDRGLTLFLAPAYLGWECAGTTASAGFCREMIEAGEEVMRDWGRWMGERYRGYPNIVWIHGGDADAEAHGALGAVNAVAEGIAEVDAEHLSTAFCNRGNSALDCYDQAWLDLNSTYGDCQTTPQLLRTDYLRSPARPFFFIEGRYEFEHDWTDVCLRSQAYWALLSGAFGQTFGIHEVHAFDPGWKDRLDSPGTRSMQVFRRLQRSRAWHLLEPDDALLLDGAGSIDGPGYAAAARASDGSFAMVYVPERRILTVDPGRIADDLVNCWWFDPAGGTATFIDLLPSAAVHDFAPPLEGDWLLVLDALSAGYASPGTVPVAPEPTLGRMKYRHRGS